MKEESPPGCASRNRMLAAEQTGIDGSDVPIVRWSGFVGLAASPYLVADVAGQTTALYEIVEVHENRVPSIATSQIVESESRALAALEPNAEPSGGKDVPVMTYKMRWGRPAILCLSEHKTAAALTDIIDGVTDQRRCYYLPHASPSNPSLNSIQSGQPEGVWIN